MIKIINNIDISSINTYIRMENINNCFCLPPICLIYDKQNVYGCFGLCFYSGKDLGNCCEYLCPCNYCNEANYYISPCFCMCYKTKKQFVSGISNDEEINKYILDNKLRIEEKKYIIYTCGYNCIETKYEQTQTNEELKKIVTKKLIDEKLKDNEINLSKIIIDYIN
jgi:hypothetical protein